ncbi:MAG: hypothetical protein AAFR42_08840 [Cyanobacteria bacterium J06628_6]
MVKPGSRQALVLPAKTVTVSTADEAILSLFQEFTGCEPSSRLSAMARSELMAPVRSRIESWQWLGPAAVAIRAVREYREHLKKEPAKENSPVETTTQEGTDG